MVHELIRNLSLTFVAVIFVTLTLIANVRVTALVVCCVIFTVSNVGGYAYYLGIILETILAIILILSCGLALDYAAHIGVAYVCSREYARKGIMPYFAMMLS